MKASIPAGNRILVAGLGIAGPALALELIRRGFAPTIVERAPEFRTGGYMMDLWGVGYDGLERLGIVGKARATGYSFDVLKVVNARGSVVAGIPGDAVARNFGERYFSIMRGDLARILFESVRDACPVRFGTSVTGLRQDDHGVSVAFTRGPEERFDWVAGADGLHSRIRECILGPVPETRLGYGAASFSTDGYPHRDEGAYATFVRPGRMVSRYALRGGRSAFLLVFATDRDFRAPASLGEQKDVLDRLFRGQGWECDEILDRLGDTDALYFDSVAQVRVPRWSEGRVVLLGDAAYGPSLLAGAGAAFAMLGAHVLAGEIAQSPSDPGAAFARYESRLRTFIDSQQRSARRSAWWIAPKSAFGVGAMRAALAIMKFRPLADALIRRMFLQKVSLPAYAGAPDQ